MADALQNKACTTTADDRIRNRILLEPPARSGRRTARRARTTFAWSLQLFWSERQLAKSNHPRADNGTRVAENTSQTQQPHTSHMGAIREHATSQPASRAPHSSPNLGHVVANHISGRAGWWKSPCPDLVGASAEQSAGATRHPVVNGFTNFVESCRTPHAARGTRYAAWGVR